MIKKRFHPTKLNTDKTGGNSVSLSKLSPERDGGIYSQRPLHWIMFCIGFFLTSSFFAVELLEDESADEGALSFLTGIEANQLATRKTVDEKDSPLLHIFPPGPPLATNYSLSPVSLVSSSTCAGCNMRKIKSTVTCGKWMMHQAKKLNITLDQAGLLASNRFPKRCDRCNPNHCNATEHGFWPLDGAAPRIYSGRSVRLNIPAEHRISESAMSNLELYFKEPKNQRPYLWEWNPSIAQLPRELLPSRYKNVSTENLPVYIASFRVSKQQNCFNKAFTRKHNLGATHTEYRKGFVDLAGIALLREDFSIVEQGLFDLRGVIKRDQDLRLFILPPDGQSNERRMYISAFHQIVRFWLSPPEDMSEKRLYHDKFDGQGNSLTLFLHKKGSCCTECVGKNFNYFVDDDGHAKVETLPLQPHTVEDVDFTSDCDTSFHRDAFKSRASRDNFVPIQSFATADELYFVEKGVFDPPYSPEHGTSCCLRIEDPRNSGSHLMVGVSHSKTILSPEDKIKMRAAGAETESRQYLSRFYAFEPKLPYRTVAVSGGFCMPFPPAYEAKENYNSLLVAKRPYQLGPRELNCPYITFVSGIVEKVGDPTRAVLSYGLNDCTSRIVEVSKEDITHMLFDPIKRLNQSATSAS